MRARDHVVALVIEEVEAINRKRRNRRRELSQERYGHQGAHILDADALTLTTEEVIDFAVARAFLYIDERGA